MAKDPAFLFYSQDFLVGTMAMPFEERGRYITLLCYIHQNGPISEETIRLLVGSFSDILRLKFLQNEIGLFYNNRLSIEVEKRLKFTESRTLNGSKGGRPKKEQPKQKLNKTTRLLVAKPTKNLIEDVNVINNDIELFKDLGEKSKITLAFEKYLEMRKQIKKVPTAHAIDLIKKEVWKLAGKNEDLAIAILNQSTKNNWTDVYQLKENNNNLNKKANVHQTAIPPSKTGFGSL